MSRESHKRFLEQAAMREAQKALEKKAPNPLSRESFAQLSIQTVEPWKRIFLTVVGLPFLGVGIALICAGPFWAGTAVAAVGVGILVLAALGRKKTIDAALDSADVIHLASQIFDAL